ncbi:ABC transporter permease [Streptomyces sp. NPDC058374]|uniref:ABC transporter permease n=1 Tax=unclassified Streptomyces TaxID=2593676 RepID=UPI00365875C0
MSEAVSQQDGREAGAARFAWGKGYGPGVRRGTTEFVNSLRTPTDLTYYVVGSAVFLFIILRNRNSIDETTGISSGALMLPGVLAFTMIFAALFGLATAVATEREDGTLLRAKSLPHGTTGYVVGQSTRAALEVCFSLTLLLVPGLILLDDGWSGGLWGVPHAASLLLLGVLASTPLGFAIGSLVKNPRTLGGWGFLAMGGLVGISGTFVPLSLLPGWLAGVAQVFPLYWLGHGLRSAMLPDAAAAGEINGSWQVWESYAVLGAWALVGLLLAPVLLRRMARRESGAAVSARRETALQRV